MLQEANTRRRNPEDMPDCTHQSVNEIFNAYLAKYDVCQVVQEYNRAGAAGVRRYLAAADGGMEKETVQRNGGMEKEAVQGDGSMWEDAVHGDGGEQLLSIFPPVCHKSQVREQLQLVPCLRSYRVAGNLKSAVQFKIRRCGEKRFYALRHLRNFLVQAKSGATVRLGKDLEIDTGNMEFADSLSDNLWEWLPESLEEENLILRDSSSRRYAVNSEAFTFKGNQAMLTPGRCSIFLQRVGNTPFEFCADDEMQGRMVCAAEGLPQIDFRILQAGSHAVISCLTNNIVPVSGDYRYIMQDNKVYHVPKDFAFRTGRVMEIFNGQNDLQIPLSALGEFLLTQLPEWEKFATVDLDKKLEDMYDTSELQVKIYLNYEDAVGLEAKVLFAYGDTEFYPLLQEKLPLAARGTILIRDMTKENEIFDLFYYFSFEVQDELFLQKDDEKTFDFLKQGLPILMGMSNVEIFYANSLKKKPVMELSRLPIGVSLSDGNLLKVSLRNEKFNFNELIGILRAYKLKERYYKLSGEFIDLENDDFEFLEELLDNLQFNISHESFVEVPLSKAVLLEDMGRAEECIELTCSRRLESVLDSLHHPECLQAEVPESLRGILREYQVTGFKWLKNLASMGLGGILADDMGLGKTLQVISFLLSEKENHHVAGNGEKGQIALVVVPASLIYNWQAEIKKFAPALRAELVYGDKPHRRMLLGRLAGEGRPDLLLTTYGMLKRDIDEYAKIKFSYCFLDEAQHIKNMAAKVTRAAKKIQAGSCFALTGTPIENNLSELWSIFDFFLPGYLHNYPMFMSKYEIPIIRENNTKTSNKLLRRIAPFILRRMKKDVLAELPEKIESRMVSEMTELQQKVYKSYFAHSQRYLRRQLMKHGLRQGEFLKIIVLLTRLRQIACDPGVFLQNYDGGSGKLNMLEELVQNAVAAGHHLLIFSQFTGMLDRIGERLQGRNIAYYRLYGKTPVRKRMELVENFNQGQMPVFLISLKAGGTGLNLTGADMVIHYDPWWNPAVEDQATDRAYRIGQSKNIQVIKLIAQGTIEEKIYDLQVRKKAIIAKLIKPGESFINGLDEQEIMELFS